MREKLIELLKEDTCPGLSYEDCAYCKYDGEQDCFYKSQAAHLIANGVVISNSETTTKWIPVTERLPEYETEVLTYRKSGISVETRWRTYWDYDEFSDSPVTHWMNLPEPPKGE